MSPKKPPTKTKVINRYSEPLSVPLSADDYIDRSHNLTLQLSKAGQHEDHAKSVKANLKAEEERIQAEVHRLANIVRNKCEPRDVLVHDVANYEDGEVQVIRQDTGEIIRFRPMTAEERQGSLPLGLKAVDAEKAKEAEQEKLEKEADKILADADGKKDPSPEEPTED